MNNHECGSTPPIATTNNFLITRNYAIFTNTNIYCSSCNCRRIIRSVLSNNIQNTMKEYSEQLIRAFAIIGIVSTSIAISAVILAIIYKLL